VGNVASGPGVSVQLALSLPGSFNLDNAVIALAAASSMGSDPTRAAQAMASVSDVAGRFIERTIDSVSSRLMLAKNPAGWAALLGLVSDDTDPVVVSINARTADGADPSWLFDVDFGALSGRRVIATGDRWRDLSVRLRYCEVDHETDADPRRAITRAAGTGSSRVEVIGNYTAFRDLLEAR
jgi:UDP-N-acetylmuramyl tripeptide synthase